MIERLKNIILYAGLNKDEYNIIKKDVNTQNRFNLVLFSIIANLFLVSMFVLSFFSDFARHNRLLYLIATIVSLMILLTALYNKKNSGLLLFGVYIFTSILLAFGIGLGIENPNETTTTFFVLLMVVPLLFYDKPIRFDVFLIIFTVGFIVTVRHFKTDIVLGTDIGNAIIFGALSCVVNTSMLVVKYKRIWYENQTKMYAETDVLTGLKNRNCFENKIHDYPKFVRKNLLCIYVDVNGLHELNNTKGHEAGDRMLQSVAHIMQNTFGINHTYRIGGDEFVAFVLDESSDFVETKMKKISEEISCDGYHISYGVKCSNIADVDIDEMIRESEELMYLAKKTYYESIGYVR